VRENNVFASQNYFFLAPIFRLQAFSDDFWISYFVFSGLKNVIVNIFLQKIWLLGNRQTATKSVCAALFERKEKPWTRVGVVLILKNKLP